LQHVNTMNKNPSEPFHGVVFAVGAYLTWGVSPAYFKLLKHVAPFEILMHRMLWSLVLLLPLILITRQGSDFMDVLRNRRTIGMLCITTAIVAGNWFLFIWAINTDRILQASLGYYINPLVNVLLGTVFLRERLRPLQKAAVAIAAAGVLYLTLQFGEFPWIALTLAVSFGSYGLIRKVTPVGALVGLTTELLILFLPALGFIAHQYLADAGAFLRLDRHTDLLLAGCSLVTAMPLIMFISGVRRLHLSTMGFLQYIAPSCTFLLAVFIYGEPLNRTLLTAFILIWSALAVFSYDSLRHYQRRDTRPDLSESLT